MFSIIDFDSLTNNLGSVTFFDTFNKTSLEIKVASALSPINTLVSILYVYLLTQGRRSSYIYGIFSSMFYAYIAFSLNYIGEFVLSLIYVPFFLFGIYSAYKHNSLSVEKLKKKEVKSLKPINYIYVTMFITILVIMWFFLIPEISKSMIGSYAFSSKPAQWGIDAITNGLNVVGIILMIRGYRNQYDIWLLVNILSISIYVLIMIDGQYFALSLIIVFLTYLAATIYGIRSWYFGNVENKPITTNTTNNTNLKKLLN